MCLHLTVQYINDAAVHFLLTLSALLLFPPTYTVLVSSFLFSYLAHNNVHCIINNVFSCSNNTNNTYNCHHKFTVHGNNKDVIVLRFVFLPVGVVWGGRGLVSSVKAVQLLCSGMCL